MKCKLFNKVLNCTEGNEFAQAPSYMLGFGVDWAVTDKFNLRGQVRLMDGYYSDIANTKALQARHGQWNLHTKAYSRLVSSKQLGNPVGCAYFAADCCARHERPLG